MAPVPQLKLGANGEIVLDEKSLVIETTGDKEARETLANADIVYDDEFSGCKLAHGFNTIPDSFNWRLFQLPVFISDKRGHANGMHMKQ